MNATELEQILRSGKGSLEGKSVGGRVLGAEVGRDPWGVIHEAKSAGERVHVRLLLPDPESGEVARLAKAARGLGKVEDGIPVLELPLPRGVELRARLAQGPFAPEDAKTLLLGLARAIAKLHGGASFHGALAPSSVHVGPNGLEARSPALSGWSPWRLALAKEMAHGPHMERTLEALSVAAPEQLAARDAASARAAGAQNDVYGLGVLLYALLTGRLPYAGDGPDAVIEAVLKGAPARPRKLVHDVSRTLDALVLGCLAKNPALRPKSVAALVDLLVADRVRPSATSEAALVALGHASDASGVSPPPPPPRAPFRILPLAIVLLVLAGTGVGIAFALHEAGKAAFTEEIDKGDAALEKGNSEQALAAFERALALDSSSPLAIERVEKARATVTAAKKRSDARSLIGRALRAAPRSDARLALLDEAALADPAFPDAQRERLRFLVERAAESPPGSDGRRKALALAHEALKALGQAGGKSAADALLEAHLLVLERGDPAGPLARAADAEPRSPAGAAATAELALRRGDLNEAVLAADRALAERPLDPDLVLLKSRIWLAQGEIERARTQLEAALVADPESRVFRVATLHASLEARDLQRVKKMLEQQRALVAADADLLAARAYLELLQGQRDEAGASASRALDLDPGSPYAHLVRARVYLGKNDLVGARHESDTAQHDSPLDLRIISKALEGQEPSPVPPDRAELLGEIAGALDETADRALARRLLDQACVLAPDDERYRLMRGNVHYKLADYERALMDGDALVARWPRDLSGHTLRARTLEALGRNEDAVQEYGSIIGLAPSSYEYRGRRGIVLHALRRLDEAKADLEAYVGSKPPPGPLLDKAKNLLEKLR